MKSAIVPIICIAMFTFIGCMPEEVPYDVSVTSIAPGSLSDYTGSGAVPESKADVLAGALPGIASIQASVTGVMSNAEFQALPETKALVSFIAGLDPKRISRSIEGYLDTTLPDVSGSFTIDNEPIVYEATTIGTVDSFYAGFSAHMNSSASSMSVDADGDMNASISINTFTHENYTVTDGIINAAAKARLNAQASLTATDFGTSFNSIDIDYNIGAALSAGFSVSSESPDAFVGKYIIEFSYSATKAFSVNASNPTDIAGDIGITVTIKVYDNDDNLIVMKTYNESDLLSVVVVSEPTIDIE